MHELVCKEASSAVCSSAEEPRLVRMEAAVKHTKPICALSVPLENLRGVNANETLRHCLMHRVTRV